MTVDQNVPRLRAAVEQPDGSTPLPAVQQTADTAAAAGVSRPPEMLASTPLEPQIVRRAAPPAMRSGRQPGGIAWQFAISRLLSWQNLHVSFAVAEPERYLAARLMLLRASHADVKAGPQNTRKFDKDGELGIRDGVTKCNSDACKQNDPSFRSGSSTALAMLQSTCHCLFQTCKHAPDWLCSCPSSSGCTP